MAIKDTSTSNYLNDLLQTVQQLNAYNEAKADKKEQETLTTLESFEQAYNQTYNLEQFDELYKDFKIIHENSQDDIDTKLKSNVLNNKFSNRRKELVGYKDSFAAIDDIVNNPEFSDTLPEFKDDIGALIDNSKKLYPGENKAPLMAIVQKKKEVSDLLNKFRTIDAQGQVRWIPNLTYTTESGRNVYDVLNDYADYETNIDSYMKLSLDKEILNEKQWDYLWAQSTTNEDMVQAYNALAENESKYARQQIGYAKRDISNLQAWKAKFETKGMDDLTKDQLGPLMEQIMATTGIDISSADNAVQAAKLIEAFIEKQEGVVQQWATSFEAWEGYPYDALIEDVPISGPDANTDAGDGSDFNFFEDTAGAVDLPDEGDGDIKEEKVSDAICMDKEEWNKMTDGEKMVIATQNNTNVQLLDKQINEDDIKNTVPIENFDTTINEGIPSSTISIENDDGSEENVEVPISNQSPLDQEINNPDPSKDNEIPGPFDDIFPDLEGENIYTDEEEKSENVIRTLSKVPIGESYKLAFKDAFIQNLANNKDIGQLNILYSANVMKEFEAKGWSLNKAGEWIHKGTNRILDFEILKKEFKPKVFMKAMDDHLKNLINTKIPIVLKDGSINPEFLKKVDGIPVWTDKNGDVLLNKKGDPMLAIGDPPKKSIKTRTYKVKEFVKDFIDKPGVTTARGARNLAVYVGTGAGKIIKGGTSAIAYNALTVAAGKGVYGITDSELAGHVVERLVGGYFSYKFGQAMKHNFSTVYGEYKIKKDNFANKVSDIKDKYNAKRKASRGPTTADIQKEYQAYQKRIDKEVKQLKKDSKSKVDKSKVSKTKKKVKKPKNAYKAFSKWDQIHSKLGKKKIIQIIGPKVYRRMVISAGLMGFGGTTAAATGATGWGAVAGAALSLAGYAMAAHDVIDITYTLLQYMED